MSQKDDLGDRMKHDYENRTRIYLPRRTYTFIRADGKSFHTFTKGFDRPYDEKLMAFMDAAAKGILKNFSGARFAYVQSDEITILLTDFETRQTEAMFDGNLQKIASVAASAATAAFNMAMTHWAVGFWAQEASGQVPMRKDLGDLIKRWTESPAMFDARVWTVPQRTEAYNTVLWRQQDATKNAISMTAQAHLSHTALQGKNGSEMQEMLFQEKGINFNDLPAGFKRGRFIEKVNYKEDVPYWDKRKEEWAWAMGVERSKWEVVESPIFSADPEWLLSRIPENK